MQRQFNIYSFLWNSIIIFNDITFLCNINRKTPLFYACKQDNIDAVKLLISKGAKIPKKGISYMLFNKNNPIFEAFDNHKLQISLYLLSQGIDVNMVDILYNNDYGDNIPYIYLTNHYYIMHVIEEII